MAPSAADATILILDIGRHTTQRDNKNEATFFEKGIRCISTIIERKIFTRPRDLVGLILMGSTQTNNELSQYGGFDNIEVVFMLQEPQWDLLQRLPKEGTENTSDWVEALLIAAYNLKNNLSGKKVRNKKIVLMTDFKSKVKSTDDVEKVIEGFKSEGFELDVIGLDIFNDDETKTKTQLAHQNLVKNIIEVNNGIASTFEEVFEFLTYHRKRATNPSPWNAYLTIGPNVKIPISAYGRTRDETISGEKWNKAYRDAETKMKSQNVVIEKISSYHKQEDNSPVSNDIITGYHYGQTIIPFSDLDQTMKYVSGAKGLFVYGFTKEENVTWQHLVGNGATYVLGKKGDKLAQQAIRTLVHCMKEKNLVGIARKVYADGYAPAMHVLFPIMDAEFFCLSMVQLAFKEDLKNMAFPSIEGKAYTPTSEQVDSFVTLIDKMDLNEAYPDSEDKEAFPVGESANPTLQYTLDCMAYRALHPDEQLPPPRDEIIRLIEMPQLLKKNSKAELAAVKALCPLKEIKKQKKSKKHSDGTNMSFSDIPTKPGDAPHLLNINTLIKSKDGDVVTHIGTVDPINDFKSLLAQGKTVEELGAEVTEVIEMLTYLSHDDEYDRPLSFMDEYRKECVKNAPLSYNNWLQKFKNELEERQKRNVIVAFSEKKLNLITSTENAQSTVTDDEIMRTISSLITDDESQNFAQNCTVDSDIMDLFNDI